jgi:hypothetical protein
VPISTGERTGLSEPTRRFAVHHRTRGKSISHSRPRTERLRVWHASLERVAASEFDFAHRVPASGESGTPECRSGRACIAEEPRPSVPRFSQIRGAAA